MLTHADAEKVDWRDTLKKLRKELEEVVRAYEDGDSAGSGQLKQVGAADGDAGILKAYDGYRKCEASLKKDLTTFLNELILGLETEFDQEIITKQHYDDYVRLVYYAGADTAQSSCTQEGGVKSD